MQIWQCFQGADFDFASATDNFNRCVRGSEANAGPRASMMKPAPFKYVVASSLDHALSVKAEYGDEARFLAGGQSLIPAMNFRLARPAVLIDINGLKDLAGVDQASG